MRRATNPPSNDMSRASNTDDRRAQIVDALIAVMAKHGYDGASIADIARKAGLAPGLVHYHFDSKLEISIEAVRKIAGSTTARSKEHWRRRTRSPMADVTPPPLAMPGTTSQPPPPVRPTLATRGTTS